MILYMLHGLLTKIKSGNLRLGCNKSIGVHGKHTKLQQTIFENDNIPYSAFCAFLNWEEMRQQKSL